MKVDQLDYELPSELIAQDPVAVRSESRLLVLDRAAGSLTDTRFSRVGDFLRPGDCLVLNDTRVLPARFFARRETGGRLEGLFLGTTTGCERVNEEPGQLRLAEPTGGSGKAEGLADATRENAVARACSEIWQVYLKGAGKLKAGECIRLQGRDGSDYCPAELLAKKPDGLCLLAVHGRGDPEAVLARIGFPPLPPYIHRDRDPDKALIDGERYQTVYARHAGAVAAPTAGLHFTQELIRDLQERLVRFARVTLHVGAGTFKPIATERVEDHPIHYEWYRLDEENAAVINAARGGGGRIIAVGTTAVRTLETVADGATVKPGAGMTNLFITPGCAFRIVDAMITNFHLPRSTLLALVAAFAGLEQIHKAYRHAIEQRYRFYSYGDAMLIL